jgi:pimeloyl-ACP methyl ester carboxylesterase
MLQPAFADLVIGGRSQRLEYAWIGAADPGAPVIVFLHEGLGSLAMWKDYPAELCAAASARGLVFSRYGYGRSTPRPALEKWPVEFMHAQAVEVLPALFAQVQLHDPPWLFGHSDGASIALLYAAAHSERVAGVVAVAPHVFVEDVSVASIEQARVAYAGTGALPRRPGLRVSRLERRLARPGLSQLEHRVLPCAHTLSGIGRARRGRRIWNDGAD